ncbi:hypothetical protein D0469_20155 [Peribacillus saganii]|uniref:Citrate transporter-like domain-containing protein n=1 Tax=Peribacillus saganii TaxID=2303992 RepID=A0A372LAJ8_9BACI|nr:hypothetical protein [Peribacillus saganii]RFU62789.1 hypothetical protein D0469_20155 [Peribacillus saganii]
MLYSLFSIPLEFFLIGLVVLAFIISWPWMAPFPKIMSGLLLLLGNVLFFITGGSGSYWASAILDNVALVTLFVTVPLLSYPLRNGGYIEYTDHFITRYLKTDIKKVTFVTALTCIVSSFLNLGSIRVMYDLFSERFGNSSKLFARSLVQGFSLAAFWSPYFAGVAIILHLVGVRFISFFLYGLLMVFICYLTSIFINYQYLMREEQLATTPLLAAGNESDEGYVQHNFHTIVHHPVKHQRGVELIIAFIGLFLALFLLEKWLHYNVLILISILAISYSILWSIAIGKIKEYIFSLKNYFTVVAPNVHTESIMIISATFFSQMVLLTEFPDYISGLFFQISNLSLILTIFIIIFTCAVSSIFIHQILPISLFATTLSPEIIGLKPELFALTLVISWGITPLISPVSAANLLAANLFKTRAIEIGIWNIKYTVSIIFLSSVLIFFLNNTF